MKQNPNPSFLIYDASAGSGKTYALVRDYLQTVLRTDNPKQYQSILAITFTNKAAQEMKTRVLMHLEEFSSTHILLEPTELFLEIVALCGTTKQMIQQRAAQTLSHLLQNYSHFSITTIDSLTHQIVRTFSKKSSVGSSRICADENSSNCVKTRVFISCAALFVNVMVKIDWYCSGLSVFKTACK